MGGGITLVGSEGFEATDLIFEDVSTPLLLRFVSGTVRRVSAITLFSGYGINMADSQLRLEDSYFGEGARTTLDLSSDSELHAVNSHFAGGSDITMALASKATVSITASNILHQAPLTILTVMDPGPELIWNLENNYWGSTDSTEIASWILDGRDPGGSVQRPIIDFVPFLTQPVTVSQPSRSFGSLKSQFRQSPE